MGNCQAIDNASLVIQYPNGKAEKLYCPVSAKHVMKMNPGHYVALLLTTTLYTTPSAASAAVDSSTVASAERNKVPLRVTRIKLLRPTDALLLGHVYRLVTAQEVMKGLRSRKQGYAEKYGRLIAEKHCIDFESEIKKYEMEKIDKMEQVKNEKQRSRGKQNNISKNRAWHPALNSISEAAT